MKIEQEDILNLQAGIQKNCQKSFENLYRLFFARLYNFAMQYVHKREIAEEIVNDVMVKIWNRRETISEIKNLKTYLFIAIRNQCLNHISQFSTLHVVLEPERNTVEVIDYHNPERELELKEIYFQLNKGIDELPDQCRTVYKLIKEDGFKYKQVAEILNLSPRTVETQLFRAIKKLDKVMELYIDVPRQKTKKIFNSLLSII